jgi:hypothetical protein
MLHFKLMPRRAKWTVFTLAIIALAAGAALWAESYSAGRAHAAFLSDAAKIAAGSSEHELATLNASPDVLRRMGRQEEFAECDITGGDKALVYGHEYRGFLSRAFGRHGSGRDELWVCVDPSGRVVKTSYVFVIY